MKPRMLAGAMIVLASSLTHPALARPAPALIAGATAEGGVFWVCPSERIGPAEAPSDLSPEFDGRLASRFGPGTPEGRLTSELLAEGFEAKGACADDPSVRWARYFDGGGLLGGGVMAIAVWKVDTQGRIVWTRGSVEYGGL